MKRKKLKISFISLLVLIIVLCASFYIYTLDYNHTNSDVFDMDGINNAVTIENMTVFYSKEGLNASYNSGIIFYPGGKVEASAYSPLLLKLAEKGLTCILVEMPMNLAIFNIKGADKVFAEFPDIEQWYLMGHSLGGVMASQYAKDNFEKLNGLILLGAYPLNDSPVDTIVIYGSQDIGLNREKLVGLDNLYEIDGGNHSYFGNYGENHTGQKRDGVTTITEEEQQKETVEIIMDYFNFQ